MKELFLEVTFRRGRPLAAYLFLRRKAGDKSFRTEMMGRGTIVDFEKGSRSIGVEITAPEYVTADELNLVLEAINAPTVSAEDLAPQRAGAFPDS